MSNSKFESEKPPLTIEEIFRDRSKGSIFERAFMILGQVRELDTEYRPWRKLRPIARDAGLDPVDAWAAAKFLRSSDFRAISLYTSNFGRFGYSEGRYLAESLHRIDRAFGGGGAASLEHGMLSDDAHRTRLRIRTLMDEAAESSLIEGAATTRKDAIELLRSRRDAKTKGERMVMNNFAAMQQIKQWRDRPLSPEMLRELQGILTEGTLKNPEESRRFRRLDEPVRVEHEITGEVIHTPPPAESLPGRVEALCAFANKVHKGAEFIHPIVKASILHFMIGYDHPFVDGNGRTARAVFYWYALRQGYSIFEYIPISERIRAGRSRYPQAYIDCELDEGDLTYFVLYKLDMIEQSLDALAAHIRHEEDKIKRSERLLRLSKDLSLRQRLILEHAIRHPRTTYTVKSHMNSNGITAATARKDLDDLVRRRLMTTSKRAREVLYIVVPTLQNRLQKKGL